MATIEERVTSKGKKKYRAVIRLKGHRPQRATFDRKSDAKEWIQNTESAIREGRYFKTRELQRRTVGDLIDKYVEEVLPRKGGSEHQQEKERQELRWWKKQMGARTLADATSAVIAEGRDALANEKIGKTKVRTRSNATVNRYLAILSHAFTVAVKEWEWLPSSPVRNVSRLKEPPGRARFLDEDEIKRLLKACKESYQPFLYPVVVLALSTGARQGELLSLRWGQVDIKANAIRLEHTKNKERRSLPLHGRALEEMERLSKVRRIDTDLVFPRPGEERPFELQNPWKKALKAAGISDFRFHDLRHTAASYLAMSGAEDAVIGAVLGHKTAQMVKRYTHLRDSYMSKKVEAMNEKMFSESS